MTQEKSDSDEDAAKVQGLLSSDHPRERLADDRLGYANFARAIARSISGLSPSDGIVLAVHGP